MAEGIMALPPGAAGEPMGAQEGPMGAAAPYAAAKNTLDQMDPEVLSQELMSAAAEVDPQAINELLSTISAGGISQAEINEVRRVVDEVKAGGPEGYPDVRGRLLAEGVEPELLPPQYDPEFFTALAMVADLLVPSSGPVDMQDQETMSSGIMGAMPESSVATIDTSELAQEGPVMPPQNFARGGIAELPSDMTSITEAIRSMGRNGDTVLAHITPEEARLLKARGGSGTINPMTGLPEFFIGKVFRAVGRGLKAVGRAVTNFVKSPVGRLVTGLAIGTVLGPAAATSLFGAGASVATVFATSAAVGTFGSGLLAGDGLKRSLINGLLVGGLSYAGASAFGGESMSQAYAGQQGAATTVADAAKSPLQTAKNIVGMGTPGGEGAAAMARSVSEGTAAATGAGQTMGTSQLATQALPSAAQIPGSTDLGAAFFPGDASYIPAGEAGATGTAAGTAGQTATTAAGAAGQTAATTASQAATSSPGMLARAKAFWNAPSLDAFQNIFVNPQATTFLGKYGPALGAGYLALGASGAFTAPEQEAPGIIPRQTGEDIIAANPQDYPDMPLSQAGLRQPTMVETPSQFGFPTTAQTEAPTYIPTGISALPTAQGILQPYNREGLYNVPQMYRAARGSGPEGVQNFPRKNGHISGPGTGTSDDIPAMLSDGEFVFTAQAVRNMGGGSRRKGAARMYKMMKMLEGGPVGGTRSS